MQAFIILLVITFSFFSVKSSNLNIIRDAETENFLKEISYILIKDNNLELNNLNFFIDNKDFINAFVIPGQKIFLTRGLLMKSKKIEDLAGVIAHEMGHIIGGHFSEKLKAAEKTSMISIISSILAAGAIAAGAGQAGSAILLGGQQLGASRFLSFSRSQESLADQNAIKLLKKSGFSLQGMLNIFKILERNESLKQLNPYFLTHPLSSERKKNIYLNLENQKTKSFGLLEKKYNLIKAKINGFFLDDEKLKKIYDNKSTIDSFYAFALRNYRVGKIDKALKLIDQCIKIDNKNPYFYELKGQILFENGKIIESIPQFRKAIELNPNEKAFRLFLAKSLHHINEETSYLESIKILWSYIKEDDFPYEAWHYLGLNYGKLKKHDFSSYALAEKYLLVNQIKNAKIHIQRVKRFTKDPVLKNKIMDLEKEVLKRKSE